MPAVTAILPVKSASRIKLARKAVNQFVRQLFSPFELIVVNSTGQAVLTNKLMSGSNCSSGTLREIEVDPGLPAGAMRNQGIMVATSDWIFPIDDDDYLHPFRLIYQMAHREDGKPCMLKNQLLVDVSSAMSQNEDSDGVVRPLLYLKTDPIGIPATMLFPRMINREVVLYDEDYEKDEHLKLLSDHFSGPYEATVCNNDFSPTTPEVSWQLLSVGIWHGNNVLTFDEFFEGLPRPIERAVMPPTLSAVDAEYLKAVLKFYNFDVSNQ